MHIGHCEYLHESEANLAIWKESLFAVEFFLLHTSPIYYGLAVPKGDQSAVITIPGLLAKDDHLSHMCAWLGLIGYRPYRSGIEFNDDCPNHLIKNYISRTIDVARRETGRRVHLIGHSLGGILARSIAAQRPNDVASVITIASPFRGAVAHRNVLRVVKTVRSQIAKHRGPSVSPNCYRGHCECRFARHLRSGVPRSVIQTAIYTYNDGIVDWRYCITGDPELDFEAPGTHIGLVVNASVYSIIAKRLAQTHSSK